MRGDHLENKSIRSSGEVDTAAQLIDCVGLEECESSLLLCERWDKKRSNERKLCHFLSELMEPRSACKGSM